LGAAEDEREAPQDAQPNARRSRQTVGARKRTSSKPKTASTKPAGLPLAVQLQMPYQLAATVAKNRGLPGTSAALRAQAKDCAAAWDKFLQRWPELHEMIEKGMISGDIIGLIMAHMPIFTAAREEAQHIRAQREAQTQPAASVVNG
jgi:hypothetical protein